MGRSRGRKKRSCSGEGRRNDMRSTDGERGGRRREGGAGQLRGLLQASSGP